MVKALNPLGHNGFRASIALSAETCANQDILAIFLYPVTSSAHQEPFR